MQDQGDDGGTDAVEDGGHRPELAEMDLEGAESRHDNEVRQNERPAPRPRAPESAAQIGGVDADLDGERSRQRLADRDGLAHLLLAQPLALGDELALHLPHQRHRSAEAQEPEAKEVGHQLRDAAGRGGCRYRHVAPLASAAGSLDRDPAASRFAARSALCCSLSSLLLAQLLAMAVLSSAARIPLASLMASSLAQK